MKLLDVILIINGRSFDLAKIVAPTDSQGLDVVPAAGDTLCVALRSANGGGAWLLSKPTTIKEA